MSNKELVKTQFEVWKSKYNAIGFNVDEVELEFETIKKNVTGVCYRFKSLIKINELYLDVGIDHILKETLAHELAHAVVNKYFPNHKQAHGKEFRMWAKMVGFAGKTYHSLESVVKEKKRVSSYYMYSCNCENLKTLTATRHGKIQRGQSRFTCTRCGATIEYSGKSFKE
jgi:predicted SprT family Zn-dependent metalloprotease